MRDVGLDPALIGEAHRDDIETFIELHIEQGPFLEQEDVPVGIVERITGYRQYLVTLEGAANHAGTTPMDLRRDPMAGAAEIIGRSEEHTSELQSRQYLVCRLLLEKKKT